MEWVNLTIAAKIAKTHPGAIKNAALQGRVRSRVTISGKVLYRQEDVQRLAASSATAE
jgi:hypothetical protein